MFTGNLFQLATKQLYKENRKSKKRYRLYADWITLVRLIAFYNLNTEPDEDERGVYIETPFRLEKIIDYAVKIRNLSMKYNRKGNTVREVLERVDREINN